VTPPTQGDEDVDNGSEEEDDDDAASSADAMDQ
jgi:hypothetical protein